MEKKASLTAVCDQARKWWDQNMCMVIDASKKKEGESNERLMDQTVPIPKQTVPGT